MPVDHDAALEVGERVREMLQGLASDEERREALELAAVCSSCGEDHSLELGRRGHWACYCIDPPRESD